MVQLFVFFGGGGHNWSFHFGHQGRKEFYFTTNAYKDCLLLIHGIKNLSL